MAKRLNPRHQDMVRAKIQASQIINRLQSHALGKLKQPMTSDQIQAATVLLSYSLAKPAPELPDVGKTGNVTVQIVRYSSAAE